MTDGQPPNDKDELEGATIGRYVLDRLLGAGSSSRVYAARQVQTHHRVAIKVLHPQMLTRPDTMAAAIREATLVNAVQHPHIAAIYDIVQHDAPPQLALVMEYVDGPTLGALAGFQMAPSQALGVCQQLVSAISAVHRFGVIHRDLKPDNLLLRPDPRQATRTAISLKVIDFGVAKLGSHGQTIAGRFIGTPAYMAPEQLAGAPVSCATDVFAVAEILFEVFTGKRAYAQTTLEELKRAKLRGLAVQFADVDTVPKVIRDRLGPLLHRSLAASVETRPTIATLHHALLELLNMEIGHSNTVLRTPAALDESEMSDWFVEPTHNSASEETVRTEPSHSAITFDDFGHPNGGSATAPDFLAHSPSAGGQVLDSLLPGESLDEAAPAGAMPTEPVEVASPARVAQPRGATPDTDLATTLEALNSTPHRAKGSHSSVEDTQTSDYTAVNVALIHAGPAERGKMAERVVIRSPTTSEPGWSASDGRFVHEPRRRRRPKLGRGPQPEPPSPLSTGYSGSQRLWFSLLMLAGAVLLGVVAGRWLQ